MICLVAPLVFNSDALWESILHIKLHLQSTVDHDGSLVEAFAYKVFTAPSFVPIHLSILVDLLGENSS